MREFLRKITGREAIERAEQVVDRLKGKANPNARQREDLVAAETTISRVRFGRRALLAGAVLGGGGLAARRFGLDLDGCGRDATEAGDTAPKVPEATEPPFEDISVIFELEPNTTVRHRRQEGVGRISQSEMTEIANALRDKLEKHFWSEFKPKLDRIKDHRKRAKFIQDTLMTAYRRFLLETHPDIAANVSGSYLPIDTPEKVTNYMNNILLNAEGRKPHLFFIDVPEDFMDKVAPDLILATCKVEFAAHIQYGRKEARVPVVEVDVEDQDKSQIPSARYLGYHDAVFYFEPNIKKEVERMARGDTRKRDEMMYVFRESLLAHEVIHALMHRLFGKTERYRSPNVKWGLPILKHVLPQDWSRQVLERQIINGLSLNELVAEAFEILSAIDFLRERLAMWDYSRKDPLWQYNLSHKMFMAFLADEPTLPERWRPIVRDFVLSDEDWDSALVLELFHDEEIPVETFKLVAQRMLNFGMSAFKFFERSL